MGPIKSSLNSIANVEQVVIVCFGCFFAECYHRFECGNASSPAHRAVERRVCIFSDDQLPDECVLLII